MLTLKCLFITEQNQSLRYQTTSALQVILQQGWITFETAAHCGKLELQSNHLEKSVRGLFVETLETYIWYDFVC